MADDIVQFYGVKETVALMRKFEPDTLKNMRKDIRNIAKPAVSKIRSSSPKVAPLSGMVGNGRTAYTTPKITLRITPAAKSYGYGFTTANLVAITATGSGKQVGFDIADMAGRANKPGSYGSKSRKYVKNGKEMRHNLNGQGAAFIRGLQARDGNASRYVYKNIEQILPQIRTEVAKVVDNTIADFNKRLWRIK